jgi:hypothetical protein
MRGRISRSRCCGSRIRACSAKPNTGQSPRPEAEMRSSHAAIGRARPATAPRPSAALVLPCPALAAADSPTDPDLEHRSSQRREPGERVVTAQAQRLARWRRRRRGKKAAVRCSFHEPTAPTSPWPPARESLACPATPWVLRSSAALLLCLLLLGPGS